MKLWIKYGLLNALLGLLIGAFITLIATGEGYYFFIFGAPVAVFITGSFFWKLIVREKKNLDTGQIVITGLLTGTVSHYLTFVLLYIVMNICYWTTGQCGDSLGGSPESISSILSGAFVFSFFSLYFFGWITAPASIIIGLLLKKPKTLPNKN